MATWAIDGPRRPCWRNSSVPCDPGLQPSSTPGTAQAEQRHHPGQGGAWVGRHLASSYHWYHWVRGLHLILLCSSHTHTQASTHLPSTTLTSPLSTPRLSPPPPPPSTGCFEQGWAEQIRLMPWETLPGPEPFSSWAILGLEVARKWK